MLNVHKMIQVDDMWLHAIKFLLEKILSNIQKKMF